MAAPPHIDRQREHQANERTFLAWLRTSIALISFGFAIARFGLFLRQLQASATQQPAVVNPVFNYENLGVVMIGFGIVTILLAAWQYNRVFWQIERSAYRPTRLVMWVMTTIVLILGLFSIPLVLFRPPESPSQSPTDFGVRRSRLVPGLSQMQASGWLRRHSSSRRSG
jgi:putative membrane protein